jgi:predicted dehydrogenase
MLEESITRREFVRKAGEIAATPLLALAASTAPAGAAARRRYALVGTGERACFMWGGDLVKRYGDVVEFAGLCDINPARVRTARTIMGVECPTFTHFDEMCDRVKPEVVIVTTVDAFHSGYIVKALDRGIDVITEKPMVIDEAQCQAVLDAEKRNHRKIVVTFNARYPPKHQKIKELLLSGDIGQVLSVDFNWYLDVSHGADYFRRWHRLKSKSGSLWVHKATHHFDLMNWWLGADPVSVVADGALRVYGRNGEFRSAHCRGCPHASRCRFFYDMTRDATRMKLYADCEDADGYYRDGCVFREDIDIYDTMTALVTYSNDVTMTYSLNAFMPFEGYRVAFNGERGRLEVRDYQAQPWPVQDDAEIHLTTSFGRRQIIDVPKAQGEHGGGDDRMRDLMFRNIAVPEHMRLPDSRAGAMSCLIGIAARNSIEQKRTIRIADLVRL